MSNLALEQNQISAIFETILFRAPTALELSSYTALVNSNVFTLAGVETAIETTAEAVNFVDPIIRLYQTYFNRAPDAAGIAFWVATAERNAGGVNASASAAAAAVAGTGTGFSTSAEFKAIYGATPNADAFVVALYQNVLGRAPDDAGRAFWDSFLGGAAAVPTAAQLANAATFFTISPEFVADSTANINAFLSTAATIAVAASTATTIGAATYASGPDAATGSAQSTGQTFTLTPKPVNISNVVTVTSDLSNFLFNGVGPTLVGGDVISNVQNLNITDEFGQGFDIIPAGAQLSAITNIKLSTAGNAGEGIGTPFDTSGIAGVQTLTVLSSGAALDVVNASATTAITDIQSSSAAGAGVHISGGSSVTVTSSGGSHVVIGTESTIDAVPPTSQLPTGAVTVTENGSGDGGAWIMGGTSVTVNVTSPTNTGSVYIGNTADNSLPGFENALANTGDSPLGGATNPTGAITVTDVSQASEGNQGTTYIVVFGGSSVAVTSTSANVQIGDPTAVVASNNTTGNITVTEHQATTFNNLGNGASSENGGYVAVFGGANVTVATNTGGWNQGPSAVQIGEDASIAGTLASGVITLTNTATDLNGAYGEGGYGARADTIVGGTGVAVTETGNGVTIGSAAGTVSTTDAGNNPTGAVSVTETQASDQPVRIDGGNGVTVNAQAQLIVIGAETGTSGAQIINQHSVYTGNASQVGSIGTDIQDFGGTTVTVNTTGGGVIVGKDAVDNGTRQVPTGAVTITDTASGSGTANNDFFVVLGGTTVNITVTNSTSAGIDIGTAPVLNTAGTGIANVADDPTGNVTIMNAVTNEGVTTYGTSLARIYTNGATTVSITGGKDIPAGIVADVNSFANSSGNAVGASALTTVNLDGYQQVMVIDSNAIASVTIADSLDAARATVAEIGPLSGGWSAIPAHALALTLSNDTNTDTELEDDTATSIAVSTAGTTADDITLLGAAVTALTFNNAAALTVRPADVVSTTAAVTITATGSGALTLGDIVFWTGSSKIASVNAATATGGVSVTLDGDTTSFTGGSGNNAVTVEATSGLARPISGGSGGNNIVYLTNVATLYNPLLNPTGPIFADFTGFQTLGLTAGGFDNQPGSSGTYDVSGFSAVTIHGLNNTTLLTNAGAGESLTFQVVPGADTTWSLKTDTAADNLSVTLGVDGKSNGVDAGTLTTSSPNGGDTGIETVTIDSVGAPIGGAIAAYQNAIDLTDAQKATHGTTTLNIAGDAPLTVTDDDATITTIHVTDSAAVNVAGVTSAPTGITITGGAGLLTAQGTIGISVGAQQQVDTITINTVHGGDLFSETINGTAYHYTAIAAVAGATEVDTVTWGAMPETGTKTVLDITWGGFTAGGDAEVGDVEIIDTSGAAFSAAQVNAAVVAFATNGTTTPGLNIDLGSTFVVTSDGGSGTTFTSIQDGDYTNPDLIATIATTTPQVITDTQGSAGAASTEAIGGVTVSSVDGRGYTADQVAEIASGGGPVTGLSVTNTQSNWTVGDLSGDTTTFTSTTANHAVSSLPATGTTTGTADAPTSVQTTAGVTPVTGDTTATVAAGLAAAIGHPTGITVNYTSGSSFTVTGPTTGAFTDTTGVVTVVSNQTFVAATPQVIDLFFAGNSTGGTLDVAINGTDVLAVNNPGEGGSDFAAEFDAAFVANPLPGFSISYTPGNAFLSITGPASAAFTFTSFDADAGASVGAGLIQAYIAATAQQDTVTIGAVATGEVFSDTINGTAHSYTAVGGDTSATVAANLAGVINTASIAGVTATYTSGNSFTLSGSTAAFTDTSGVTTINNDTPYAPAGSDFTAAVDTFTTGSGGGTITIGDGGSAGGAGSETANLQASAAIRDTVIAPAGTRSVINGFSVAASPTSDVLDFPGLPVVMLNATNIVETNGVYSVSNGIFSLTSGHPTGTQELADVQAAIDAAAVDSLAAVTIAGTTYVIEHEGAGGVADTIVQLTGISGVTGFGTADGLGVALGAGDTIELAAGLLQNASHGGSAVANTIWNDAGYSLDTLTASAGGITNTFNNLTAYGALDVEVSAGKLVTTQIGASGSNELAIVTIGGATLDSVTVNGDYALLLAANANLTLNSLVDATNTVTTISVTGGGQVDVQAIADTALTTIDTSNATLGVQLGDGVGGTLTQAALTVTAADPGTNGGWFEAIASGAGDTFIGSLGSNGTGDTIVASGAGDKIILGAGSNEIFATGAGDTISIGNETTAIDVVQNSEIHASGSNNTITFATTASDTTTISFSGVGMEIDGGSGTQGIGANDTVNFANNINGGFEIVALTGTVTGATSSGAYAFTTLGNVVDNGGDQLTFDNAATEIYLGQVNVAGITTLAGALDLAAATAAQSQQGSNGAGGTIAAHHGVIDWFQFGGNTYLVEAVNSSAAGATHTALGTGDVVVKILGLVDITGGLTHNNGTGTHTLTL